MRFHVCIIQFLGFSFLFINLSLAQPINNWKILADVRFDQRYDSSQHYQISFPIFGNKVKEINGKEITLKGYIIPLEEMRGQRYFVFSMLPFNICYFCGGAGPETVIEVHSREEIPFTEKDITIRGKLALNPDDPEKLMYVLTDAVQE